MTRPRALPLLILAPGLFAWAAACGADDDPGKRDRAEPSAPVAASDTAVSDPGRLRARLCDTISNSFDCAAAIEADRLPAATGVRRHGDTLRLALADDAARYVDQPGDAADVVHYRYQDRWREPGRYLIQVQYYEGAEYLLVDDSTGRELRIPDWPVRAPGGRRFAVLSLDLVAGYGPNTLQVWELEDDHYRKVWETRPSQWGPRDGRWSDSTTLELVQHGYCAELGGEGRDFCDRPARVRKEGGSWHFSTGETAAEGSRGGG